METICHGGGGGDGGWQSLKVIKAFFWTEILEKVQNLVYKDFEEI